MEAYDNGPLLPTWSCRPEPSSGGRSGTLWGFAASCVMTVVVLLAHGAQQEASTIQLHSTTQSINQARTLTQLAGSAALPTAQTSRTGMEAKPAVPGAPLRDWLQTRASAATGHVMPSPSLLVVIGSVMLLVGSFIMGQRSQTRIAMATVSGQVDKGGDPNDMGTDAETERHRIVQRVVFSNERWRSHRSGSRFFRALLTIPQSYVVRHLVNPVLLISTVSTAVCVAQAYLGVENINLPTSLFSLSAPSLGLLLVFRTNASYERWDGARKMIGLVKNRTEDLTRQVSVRFPKSRPELKEQMMRYIHAFPFALKVHLRSGPGGFEDDSNLVEDLTPILKPNELQLLLKATNRPAHVMQCMTQITHSSGLDGAALLAFDQNLTTLADVLGGCERILRTPIPLSYTRMTTRFLFVWLLLLPLALSQEILKLNHDIWFTIPSVAFIAFVLLGIEEVAVQIEEPFSILPLEAYSEGIRKNTASIFAQMNAVSDFFK